MRYGWPVRRVSATGAVDAERDRRVQLQALAGDGFAAAGALAEAALLDPRQGRLHTAELPDPAILQGLRHGLLLHGVHAGQPADRLLIQRHRAPSFGAEAAFLLDCDPPLQQTLAESPLKLCR